MALNVSGPISLGGSTAGQSINLELSQSATAQVSMNDANVRSLAGVASGAIVMPTNFYGKSAVTITLTSQTGLNSIVDFVSAGETAVASYQIASNGKVYKIVGATTIEIEQWCTPTSAAGNYEVFATITAGSLSSGTTGAWLALSSNRTWTVTESTSGSTSFAELDMQIRKVGTTTVLATATINLEAGVL